MKHNTHSRLLGDLRVSGIGMGSMTLTQTEDHDPSHATAVVGAAIDSGVTLFDTADCYGPIGEMGINERALITAIRNIPGAIDKVIIATKGGHTRGPNATWWIDGSPEYIARAARQSLARLGLESHPLYQHHRPDPKVPYAETMGAFKQLVDEGIAQRIGVSNVDLELLAIARQELGDSLVSVQNEYSPITRTNDAILRECERLGIGFLAWGPLGGMRAAKDLTPGLGAIATIAQYHAVSPQQVALAWLLSRSPNMIAIPGASRPASVIDSAQAMDLELSADEIRQIDDDLPSPTDS